MMAAVGTRDAFARYLGRRGSDCLMSNKLDSLLAEKREAQFGIARTTLGQKRHSLA